CAAADRDRCGGNGTAPALAVAGGQARSSRRFLRFRVLESELGRRRADRHARDRSLSLSSAHLIAAGICEQKRANHANSYGFAGCFGGFGLLFGPNLGQIAPARRLAPVGCREEWSAR